MKPENRSIVRVIFAGGGTGGHVYPALAMYEGLRDVRGEDGVAALFVGARDGLESALLAGHGVEHRLLPGRGFRGASFAGGIRAAADVVSGVVKSLRIIRDFGPDVVVGTGGYASVAMVLAAILSRTPRVLQEQNSVPGLVNRRLARFADLVLLSFEESRERLPRGAEAKVIGNPLRRSPGGDREEGARFLGLDPARPTVLVIGGSRGAHSLNEAAVAAAGALFRETDVQMILLTGERDFESVRSRIGPEHAGRVAVRAYLEEVHHAYRASDIAVARSGASSVFELASFGVPAIFVPYPHAADDHQWSNAKPLETAGGAVIIDDRDLDGDVLARRLRAFLDDPERLAAMGRRMSEWIARDSARDAAGEILSLLDRTPRRTGEKRRAPRPEKRRSGNRATVLLLGPGGAEWFS